MDEQVMERRHLSFPIVFGLLGLLGAPALLGSSYFIGFDSSFGGHKNLLHFYTSTIFGFLALVMLVAILGALPTVFALVKVQGKGTRSQFAGVGLGLLNLLLIVLSILLYEIA